MSCSSEEVSELGINVMIKPYCTEAATKWENVKEVLQNQVVFTPIGELDLFLEVGDP